MDKRNIRIKKRLTNPNISDYKNFEKVLEGYYLRRKTFTGNLFILCSSLIVIAVISGYFYYQSSNNERKKITPIESSEHKESEGRMDEDTSEKTRIASDIEEKQTVKKQLESSKDSLSSGSKTKAPSILSSESLFSNKHLEVQFREAEPMFGFDSLYLFIKKELVYPKEAIGDSIEGKVVVAFIINEYGDAEDIKVERGIGYGCDEEAIKVIKKMPRWKPALRDFKPIKSKLSIPIVFKMPDTTEE